jgi:diketogulonate reductase-like aldo/keto reductase
MERAFGRTGRSVPTIGLGTWTMELATKSSIDAVRRAVDLGLTHIDTAELYGRGRVETLLGEALTGLRERVYLASKVLPSNASRKGVVRACDDSLRRLKTDRLDLYLLHWESHLPLAETIAGFEELVRTGKILAWGVSNFDEAQMEDAETVAPGRMACNQVLYHLQERAIEHAVLPWCAKHDVALVAYSPFGSGDFPSPQAAGGRVLAEVAARHEATPRQVALAFLTREAPLFTIPKASVVAHVDEIAGAVGLALTAEDLADLDSAFPRGRPQGGVPMI